MLLLLSLASSALLAPGFRGVQLLKSTPAFARSPASRMGQTPTEPAGDVANVGKRSALKGWFTSTTLDVATVFGSARLATATIKAGASLESRAKSAFFQYREVASGCTPLQLATVRGEAGVVKALVDAGASLEADGGIGSTPLQFAVANAINASKSMDVVKTLIGAGASFEVAAGNTPLNCIKNTPLQIAILGGKPEVIKLLTEAGAPLEAFGEMKITPLQLAICMSEMDAVRALIEAGASLEEARGGVVSSVNEQIISTEVGLTPLEWAIYKGKVEAMKLLLEAGAPIEVTLTQTYILAQALAALASPNPNPNPNPTPNTNPNANL